MEKKTWCVPKLTDEYIIRMNHLLDLYALPYNEKEPLVCLDEKSLQLLEDIRESLPLKTGFGIRIDYHYKRKGIIISIY